MSYSEDISQKSRNMLRLNLVINGLTHSIPNIIKTNTISEPYYFDRKFDYIVSNPPFKLDFSGYRDDLEKDAFKTRFFAGIPNVPNKDIDKMSIYLLFIQHIMYSLSDTGKAAVVVPTGFITAQSGIEKRYAKHCRPQMVAWRGKHAQQHIRQHRHQRVYSVYRQSQQRRSGAD
jgi:type I restriction enzyme M protein